MYNHSWRKELLTIPNLLSLFRLVLIPVYMQMYTNATSRLDYYLAGTVLGISCLTDLADGKIARQYNMVSSVGKLLDPLADKVTQFTLILCLAQVYRILYPILILFLVKELFQCSAMLIFAHSGKCLPGAIMPGKICTTVLFVSMLLLMVFPEIPYRAVCLLAAADAALLLYAFGGYICAYFGKNTKLTDLQNE